MKRRRGHRIFQEIVTPLVRVVGNDLKGRVETTPQGGHPDHLWISLDPGFGIRVVVSVNTWSRRNAEAGFDPRIRLGILKGARRGFPSAASASAIASATAIFPARRTSTTGRWSGSSSSGSCSTGWPRPRCWRSGAPPTTGIIPASIRSTVGERVAPSRNHERGSTGLSASTSAGIAGPRPCCSNSAASEGR